MSSPSFYILCGNAAYNRGDRGNLSAQIALLRSRYPGSGITVGSYRAEVDRLWYDADVVPRGFFFSRSAWKALKQADIVLWGGGALIADNGCRLLVPFWWLQLFVIKRILQKPVIAWAQGVITQTRMGRRIGRKAFALCDRITVRDAGSLARIRAMGIITPAHMQTADPAVLLTSEGVRACESILQGEGIPLRDRPLFIIAPTFWPFQQQATDILPYMLAKRLGLRRHRETSPAITSYMRELSMLARTLADTCNADVLFVPVYPNAFWPDVTLLEKVAQQSERPDNVFVLRHDDYAPEEYLSLWHKAACTVSTSLHHGIFSHVMDCPCVMISYEPKCHEFAAAVGTADRMVDLETFCNEGGSQTVVRSLQQTLREWPVSRERVRNGLDTLQKRARMNLDQLNIVLRERGWNVPPLKQEENVLTHAS